MKIRDLKKDKNKSVRINKEILKLIEDSNISLQSYLDNKLENDFAFKLEDLKKIKEDL